MYSYVFMCINHYAVFDVLKKKKMKKKKNGERPVKMIKSVDPPPIQSYEDSPD